jgi:hypothetical protein
MGVMAVPNPRAPRKPSMMPRRDVRPIRARDVTGTGDPMRPRPPRNRPRGGDRDHPGNDPTDEVAYPLPNQSRGTHGIDPETARVTSDVAGPARHPSGANRPRTRWGSMAIAHAVPVHSNRAPAINGDDSQLRCRESRSVAALNPAQSVRETVGRDGKRAAQARMTHPSVVPCTSSENTTTA